jgi:hypothetical protein
VSSFGWKWDLLGPSSQGGEDTKRTLEAAMQSFDRVVHLRMVSGGLTMRNVEHVAELV